MKNITNIKQISNNKYSLIIEGKKHIVYDDVLLEYNLLKKGEISEDVYEQIVKSNNYHEAYNKMLKYITAKLRTEKEIDTKLIKLGVGKIDRQKIVERLKKERYLDPEIYVKSYINDSKLLSLNGPKKIEYELKKLGFDANLIQKYINAVEDDVWFEKVNKVIQKKSRGNKLSQKMFLLKVTKDLINLGYDENYFSDILSTIYIDDKEQMKKDYEKVLLKLAKKYEGTKLKIMVKQKMFQLGYDSDKISSLFSDAD
ncbi:MAG: hypothetical protein E7164_01465 [Firmicutes bacterium]|nr:hypothetical protein [Bacillota bacterium]